MIARKRSWLKDADGGSATEFAMVVPVFFALVFAVIHLSFVMWTETSLHWAAETAARCASVNAPLGTMSGGCATGNAITATSVQSYAVTQYHGPNLSPTFTYTTPTCGKQVKGTASYPVNLVVTSVTMNLSAQACYP